MAKFKITLHRDGTQTVEVLQETGTDCVQKTAGFETGAGKVISREYKPEFYEELVDPVVEVAREVQR